MKNTHDSDSKNLGESLPRHFERSLTEADFNLCQLRICFGSFLGEFGSLQVQHLCNMVLVSLLHGCYDLHGWGAPFQQIFTSTKITDLRSWINFFWGALLLWLCVGNIRYAHGWDKSNAHKPVLPTKRCAFCKIGWAWWLVVYKTLQWYLHSHFL